MAKSEVDELTAKTLSKGGLLVKLYLDMQSNKQEELQPLLTDLINNRLLKTPGVVYCFGAIEEPIKSADLFSTSAVLTTLVKDISTLVNVSFMYAPAGIEIIKPERDYNIKINELQGIMINLSQVSVEYANYILTKVLKDDELAKVQKDMQNRADLGKRLMEKKGDKPQPS